MKIDRTAQIVQAMTGRQASAVNDNALREAVRSKLITLAQDAGKPLSSGEASSITIKVCTAAARTIIFEAEVPIALEMGAAGELSHEGSAVTSTNAPRWVTAYAVSGDRRAAQERISIAAARDRARIDAVASTELRATFEREGLRTAWTEFINSGVWDFRPGYAAVIYNRIGADAIRALLTKEQRAAAKVAARAALRRDDPRRYRTMSDEDLEDRPVFGMYWKAQLCRAYFEELRLRSLDIDWNNKNAQS